MAHIQANILKLCSNLNEFRIAEKYADVTIRCENESFKCHRIILALASDFFDTMFSGSFKESTEESIPLSKTSASTFKEILEFVYTGDVTVTQKNVLSHLVASDFFALPGLRDLCVQFISRNKMNVQNTTDLFVFACKTNQETLIDLLSKDIAEKLEIFLRANSFLELSFDEFDIVVKKYKSLPREEDETVMAAITRWILHHGENRRQYFSRFIKLIENLNRVKYEIMDFFSQLDPRTTSNHTNHIVSEMDAYCGLTHQVAIPDLDISEGLRSMEKNDKMTEKSLHVYVKYPNEKLMKVFSIDESQECALACQIPINHNDQWMKVVALDNHHLYSLHYIRRNPALATTCSQSFYAHTSVDMNSFLNLKSPPVIFGDVSMCSIRNKIFVYNQTLSQGNPSMNTSNFLYFDNEEEMSRGIYVYNCEVDNWFPVPAMKCKVEESCMTAYGGLLYLVGGRRCGSSVSTNIMQTYDYRSGKWSRINFTENYFVGADCCAFKHAVYVCGGEKSNEVERFEIKSGKWITLPDSFLPESVTHHRLNANNSGELWVTGGYNDHGIPSNNLSYLQIDDLDLNCELSPEESLWICYSSVFTQATNNDGIVLDSVVFKSLQ